MPEQQVEPEEIPRERQIIHDLRQCLYSIHLGVQILERNRENEQKFNELCAMIDENRASAARLVEELGNLRNETHRT